MTVGNSDNVTAASDASNIFAKNHVHDQASTSASIASVAVTTSVTSSTASSAP
jgi:hypothetical protein